MSQPATPATQAPTSETPATPAPAADSTPAAKVRPRDRAASVAGELRARLAAKRDGNDFDDDAPAPKAKTEPKPEPASKADKSSDKLEAKIDAQKDKIEEAGGDAPKQKKGESDEDYSLRLARSIRDLREEKVAHEKSKKELVATKEELAKLQKMAKLLEDGKSDPMAVLDHLGIDFEDLAKGLVEKKYKTKPKQPALPPELAEKIARLEKAENDREAERVKAAAEKTRDADEKIAQKYLDDHEDEFPLTAAMSWAAKQIVAQAYEAGVTNFRPILVELEAGLGGNFQTLLKKDKALKSALSKDPELKALLRALTDDGEAKPKPKAKKDEDAELTDVSSVGTDAPPRKKSKEDEKLAAIAALKARRARADDDD